MQEALRVDDIAELSQLMIQKQIGLNHSPTTALTIADGSRQL